MSPVVRALQRRRMPFLVVHSGQHYDFNLSMQFMEELKLPRPNYAIRPDKNQDVIQLGELIERLGAFLKQTKPSCVLVEGDTNTVLAGAIAANKANVRVGHVEAGLRSFDLRMPEEHNRRVVDHLSSYLFAPTNQARGNLLKESVWGKIAVTGNTVIDACVQHLPLALAKKKSIPKRNGAFALATLHRAENVDDRKTLKNMVEALMEAPVRIILPLHPRTRRRLAQFGLQRKLLTSRNVDVIEPVDYLDFLSLMYRCEVILTDSGGIQEEATAPGIRKRVLLLRKSTDRPEAVRAGFVRVVGCRKSDILKNLSIESLARWKPNGRCPYGDGRAGERIVGILSKRLVHFLEFEFLDLAP